jgi:hypothetical protein
MMERQAAIPIKKVFFSIFIFGPLVDLHSFDPSESAWVEVLCATQMPDAQGSCVGVKEPFLSY